MNLTSEHTRRIGGLLLEVLVLVFVFSGSCLGVEIFNQQKRELTVKTAPVEQIAFREPTHSLKSHTECNGKTQNSHSHYTPFLVIFESRKIVNASALSIGSSLYNIFYTHLTAQAP
jgi:hypothetical protein